VNVVATCDNWGVPVAPEPVIPLVRTQRISSLDGLRGVAALVVVIHHALLVIPTLAQPYMAGYAPVDGVYGWLLYSPLHLVWAGTEAVYVFFVLSGLVLARSVIGNPHFSWLAYFPSRLVRLYLPVAGAVVLAALSIAVVPRVGDASLWVLFHPSEYSAATFLKDLVLVEGTSNVITPLWSLQWEVLFSLLLPVFVIVARGRWLWATIAVSLVLTTLGYYTGVLFVAFMPMFAIGVALAFQWDRVEEAFRGITGRRAGWLVWPVILVVAGLMLCSYWLLFPYAETGMLTTATRPVILVGAVLAVLAAALWEPLRRVLSSRPIQWLGLISFSLYLVHDPVVVAFAYVFDGSRWAVPFAIVVSIAVAVAFFLVIERPSHRLSQSLRRALARREGGL